MSNRRALLLLAVFAFLVFAGSLRGGFINYDDWWIVHHDRMLGWLTPRGFWRLLFDLSKETRMEHGAEYLPVRDFSAALQYRLFGENPLPYHLVQVSLFAASSVLLVRFFSALGVSFSAAFAAGFLFAAHPVHAESVAWLSGHKDLLSFFFFTLCLLAYARGKFFLALAAFVPALGSKYTVLFTPLLLPFVDRCVGRPASFRRVAPFFALAAGWYALVSHVAETVRYGHLFLGNSLPAFLRNAPVIFGAALDRLFVPEHLQVLYPFDPAFRWTDLRVVKGLGGLALAGALIVGGWRRRSPAALGAALLVAGFIPMFRAPEMHLLADRYFLLPSAGFFLLAALGLERLGARVLAGVALAAVLAFGTLTFRQNRVWKSSLSLWQNAAGGRQPVHPLVWENLASASRDAGAWDQAAGYYRRLIATGGGGNALNYVDLGLCEIKRGRFAEAERVLERAVEIDPDLQKAHINLGVVQARLGKKKAAEKSFATARRLDPARE